MKRIDFNKLFPYTLGEDIANSVSHGVAALIATMMQVVLINKASLEHSFSDVVILAVYGYTIIMMFLMSCLYHGIRHYTTRDVFKRLDHSFIFLMILASYAPIVFLGIQTTLSYIVFALLSVVTIIGVVFKAFFAGRFKVLSTIIFVVMGWSSLLLIPQMMASLPSEFMSLLILGGLFYTIGAILYAVAKFKYSHFVWHLFVIAGAFSHYFAILLYIA